MSSILAFENLSIDFETPTGPVHAVRNVKFLRPPKTKWWALLEKVDVGRALLFPPQ
ncbi:MAG: hypothetical protein CM1200mP24_10200 [Gammaproteobacteria bacterium]|nr:MAG: hypothetical protein CM1200mP24_10200 [Gammaproteobacteria bacterium]